MFSVLARFVTSTSGWQRILSTAAAAAVSVVMALAVTGCGGGGGTSAFTSTVAAPGAPTNFTVAQTASGTLSATLAWSSPTTGGAPVSFEIYRSTTAGTVFQPTNHLISIPVTGGTTYTYIDNAGLSPVNTYWAVSAKNAGGETATAEVMYKPTGTAPAGFGNNFSAALIFADDIGIAGSAVPPTSVWSTTAASAVAETSTGLRPLSTEASTLSTAPPLLPYLDPLTQYVLGGVTYYKQQTDSTWQGEWAHGAATPQHVTAKWGDNLVSQSLTSNSVIRIEMVLSKALTTAMTSYTMASLYGANANEIQGTDGTAYANLTALVFASNARLTIQKMDGGTNPVLLSQPLWSGDGPGFLAGEINVSGNFTYGFVWNLKSQTLPGTITSKTGTWRLTFSLDPNNSAAGGSSTVPVGSITPASNNTFIDTATNGALDSATSAHIDIVVH